jgi:hypothetical protein
MPADALWVLSVVAGGDDDPYLTASNDVHAAVANPRTKPPPPRPTLIDARAALPPAPAGQASRRPQGKPNGG